MKPHLPLSLAKSPFASILVQIFRPQSLLSIEPPGDSFPVPKDSSIRLVSLESTSSDPCNVATTGVSGIWTNMARNQLKESGEKFDLVFGGYVDSFIGQFCRSKTYPFEIHPVATLQPEEFKLRNNELEEINLFSNVADNGYVICQMHPDAFACETTRKQIKDLGLNIHGACQIRRWRYPFAITVLSRKSQKKVISLVVRDKDDPRIPLFFERLLDSHKEDPEELIESASSKFLSPLAAEVAHKYIGQVKNLGLPLVQPSPNDDAELPWRILMEAFYQTEPHDDELLDDPKIEEQTLTPQEGDKLALKSYLKSQIYRYLCAWFHTNVGELYASILRQQGETTGPWPLEMLPPVPIPNETNLGKILGLLDSIDRVNSQSNRLEEALWNSPTNVDNHAETLSKINSPDDNTGWIDILPFPLASILWQQHTATSAKDRMGLLLKFFEGLSSLHAAMLISLKGKMPSIKNELRRSIEEMAQRNQPITRPSFGTWSNLFKRLASVLRSDLKDPTSAEYDSIVKALGMDDPMIINHLTSKFLHSIFARANDIRNRASGHGPFTDERLASIHVAELSKVLEKWRGESSKVWKKLRIVQATNQAYRKAGVHHVQAKVYIGVRQPFPTEELALLDLPDCESLYLHQIGSKSALQLEPFIRICEAAPGTQLACYYYNRSEADGAHFVTYYSGQTPEEIFGRDTDPATMLIDWIS